MKKNNTHDSGYWNKDRCKEEALKYSHRKEFQRGCGSAYTAAQRHDWIDEVCSHMITNNKPSGYWTKEKCFIEQSSLSKSLH